MLSFESSTDNAHVLRIDGGKLTQKGTKLKMVSSDADGNLVKEYTTNVAITPHDQTFNLYPQQPGSNQRIATHMLVTVYRGRRVFADETVTL